MRTNKAIPIANKSKRYWIETFCELIIASVQPDRFTIPLIFSGILLVCRVYELMNGHLYFDYNT